MHIPCARTMHTYYARRAFSMHTYCARTMHKDCALVILITNTDKEIILNTNTDKRKRGKEAM